MAEPAMAFLTTLISWLDLTWSGVLSFLMSWSIIVLVLLVVRRLERAWPIEVHDTPEARAEVVTDYKLAAANYFLNWLATPVTVACAVAVVNGLGGGGLIDLEEVAPGLPWIGALLFYLVVYDLYLYWGHRLSHEIPFLWAMHSFHHSAERITLITGARHLWLEAMFYGAFFPVMAVFFNTSPQMAVIVHMIYLIPDGCGHLNLRVRLGRFKTILNNPQWHRIHHSREPRHINKNFARLLPVMDIIFGSAYFPAEDEFPATGLIPGERPGLLEGVLWPFRRVLRRA